MRGAATTVLVACLGATQGCAIDPELARAQADFRRLKLSGGAIGIAQAEGKVDLVDDQRVTCERYTPTGSHRVQIRCQTTTEKRLSEEASAREMRKLVKPPPSAMGR